MKFVQSGKDKEGRPRTVRECYAPGKPRVLSRRGARLTPSELESFLAAQREEAIPNELVQMLRHGATFARVAGHRGFAGLVEGAPCEEIPKSCFAEYQQR